jgi:hypothetical protein
MNSVIVPDRGLERSQDYVDLVDPGHALALLAELRAVDR